MRIHFLVPTVALLWGCTAVKSAIHLTEAESSLRRAEEFEAQELARYEYVMALRYLEKAREESGHTDYRMSEKLARKSEEWSDKAIIFIERGGRAIDPGELGAMPETAVPGSVTDPPPPAQTVAPEPAPLSEPAPPPEPEPGSEFEVEDDFDWEKP